MQQIRNFISIFKRNYPPVIGLLCHLESENGSIWFIWFLIAHASKKGKGYIRRQLCKPAQAKIKLSPTPAGIRIYILKLERSADVCSGLLTPSRLDSGKRIPPASRKTVSRKRLPRKHNEIGSGVTFGLKILCVFLCLQHAHKCIF